MFKKTIGTTFSLTTFLTNPSGRCQRKKIPTANWQKAKIYLPVGRLAVFLVGRAFVALNSAGGPNY